MIADFGDERDWFFDRRFGLFVHWGLYSIPAWHEQILWRGDMSREDYELLIEEFNPVKFDPEDWLDLMEEAGMEYVCLTAKHHDGFCLFDTDYTDHNITNTPYGEDIVEKLARACHRRNVPLGLYYSIPDWHHPHYPNRGRHHEMFGPRPGDEPDRARYIEYVKNQMKELCTNYGEIHQIFWDVNVLEWFEQEVNEMIHSLQPQAVISDRGPGPGDFVTPERRIPEGKEFGKPTEAVQSLGRESWGYKKDEDYYTHRYLMKSIDKVMAMGGNYKLNVGPKADGTIAAENVESLEVIGEWYDRIQESFVGTYPASNLVDNDQVLLTKNNNTVYVHLWKEPEKDSVILNPLDIEPERAILLNNGEELQTTVDITPWKWREKSYLRIRKIPANQFTDEVMVIKLEFDESINR